MKSAILALATVISSLLAEDKVAYHCSYECPYQCPRFQCSPETLMIAAELLFGNWCTIIDTHSLNQLQELVTKKSLLEVVIQNEVECAETGFVNYLENMVPLMPDITCQDATVSAVFMEGENKVVVLGDCFLNLGIDRVDFKIRHVFEAVNGCELKLIESNVIQEECLLV